MKNISGIKFIDARDIQTTSLKVTEKIQSKYLLQFIKNNLANQELFITTNSYFYYTFLESTSTYEIIIFNHQDSFNIILEPFLFETLYKDTNPQGYDIFFTDNYFTVYKNGEFLLLKQITDVSQEDIEIYVSQTYHMDINNVTYIDKTGLGQLKEKHHTIPLHLEKKYHPVKVQSSYKLFIIYLTSSFIIFLSILLYKHTLDEQAKNTNIKPQKETIQYNKLKKIYKQHNNKIVDHMTEIFKYIKLNNILLQELTYDNKFRIIVTHKQKINLLNLISTYNKKTNISSLIFDKQYNIYKMELEIEL